MFFILLIISNEIFGQLVVSYNITNTTCQTKHGHNLDGNNIGTGRINIIASGGTAPYTYGISGSHTYTRTQNNGYFPQLYLGDYTITVTDVKGLTKDTIVHINSNLPIPAINEPTYTNPSSCVGNDGSLTIIDTAGTSPFLYSIDGGASYSTNNVFNNLSNGLYICDVQDANGCISYSWDMYIGYRGCNFLATSYHILTSCGDSTDKQIIEVLPYPKKLPYKISYEDSNHYRSFNDISYNQSEELYYVDDTVSVYGQGLHDYYVKDTITNDVYKSTFAVGLSCTLYITFVSIDASCSQNDGGLTVNAKGGVLPYTYSMDGINWQTSNTFTGLLTGNYTVTVMDANGALSSAVGTVYNKCPVISVSKTYDCSSNTGTIIASGTKGVRPYQFSIDGIYFTSDSVFSHLSTGSYTVTLKDANGNEDSIQNFRIFNTCINVTFSGNYPICTTYGTEFVTVNATGGTPPYQYQVFFAGGGYTSLSNSHTYNLGVGSSSIVVVDSNLVTDTFNITIGNVSQTLKINIGNDTTLCSGKTLMLLPNLGHGTSYLWQDGSTNSTFNITKAGKYWVYANENGCTGSDTINVSYLNLSNQIFPTHDTTLCIGNTITLNAQNVGAGYLWSNGVTTQTQTFNTPGKYWVQINLSGCSASDTINLHFITGPTVTLPADTSFCMGNMITLNAGGSGATYLWNNNSTNSSININQSGKYWIAVTQYGCTTADTIQVTQYPTPSVFLGNDTVICEGQTVLLSAPTSVPAYQYLWQDNTTDNNYTVNNTGVYSVKVFNQYNCSTSDTISVRVRALPVFSLGNDTALCTAKTLQLNINLPKDKFLWGTGNTTSSLTVSNAGLYWVQVSDSGCIKTDTINVSYKPNPQIFLGNDTTLCEGASLLLNAINSNATYQWQDGSVQPTFSVTTKGTYTVKVTGLNGCDTTGEIVIDYITKPIINLGNDTILCLADNLILNANFPNSSYLWQDSSTQPTYTVKQAGEYKVDVTNICGITTDSINIQYQNCACEFYIPSAFTPNGDGKNDTFKPNYKCFFSNYLFRIFNRWGQIIFSTQNPTEGWDGKLSGQYQPIGTYVWKLTYYDTLLKQDVTKTGTVVLIR